MNPPEKKIEQTTREQIAEFLPDAIRLAVASYRSHMTQAVEDTQFETHHKSAKVAISHIELLIKLAKWADLPDSAALSAEHSAYFNLLMEQADQEVKNFEDEEA